MDKYEKVFLEQAMLGYWEFCNRYRGKKKFEDINKRQTIQNKNFEFTKSNISKIEKINNHLNFKFREAYKQAEEIEHNLLDKMKHNDSFVKDYEIEFKISLFSENKYANNEDLQGNPFFSMKPSISYFKNDGSSSNKSKEWLLEADHNEYSNTLKNQKHCYWFHDLYDHTYLSWPDIVDIEEIWIEVIISVQSLEILHK